jgi:DNA-binding CsgD family transcriptional regulator
LLARRTGSAPDVIVVGDSQVKAATPDGWQTLRAVIGNDGSTAEHTELKALCGITYFARRNGGSAITRTPTTDGWTALHAQLLHGGPEYDMAVTIGAVNAGALLPAVGAWYGITAREQVVLARALEGLPAKLIARSLDMSVHTVNDHFKAVYRKTGVNSRDQLLAGLSM